jgi:hypothetical protein
MLGKSLINNFTGIFGSRLRRITNLRLIGIKINRVININGE